MDQCKNLVKNVNTWSETNRKLGKEMYTFVNTSTSIDSMIMKEYKESVVELSLSSYVLELLPESNPY